MADYKKFIFGFLTILIATGIIYVQFAGKTQLRVDKDKATFYINQSGWKISGVENLRLFNGTKLINRVTSNIELWNETKENKFYIYRKTPYENGAIILSTYAFDSTSTNVEFFPKEETHKIINGKDLFFRYSLDQLKDTGEKRKLTTETSMNFGYNMKVNFPAGYSWGWVGYPYGSDSFSLQYKIPSNDFVYNIKFFDPTIDLTNAVSIWNFNTTLNKTDYYKLNNLTATGSATQVSTPIDYGYTIKTLNYTDYNGLTAADSTSLSITGNLSIVVTVRANSLSSSREGFLVGKYTYPSSQRAYKLTSDSPAGSCLGNLSFTISNTAASYNGSRLCSNTPMPDDGAYHTVIATFEKNKGMNLYLDGVNVSAPNGTSGTVIGVLAGIADSTAVLGIGNDGYNRDICNCTFEEVAIFSRVLSPAEVAAYNGNITALRGILDDAGGAAPTTSSYYFAQNGSDTTGDGSQANPYKTITKMNTLSLSPGDQNLFRKGDRWNTLTDAEIDDLSGDATGNITYGAYGSGNKPIITRSKQANYEGNWTASGVSNVWNTTLTITDDVGLIIFNNGTSWGKKVSAFSSVDSTEEFYYDPGTNKVSLYSVGNPATIYTDIELSEKGNIFDVSSGSYIKIEDLDLRYSGKDAVFLSNSNHIYVLNNSVSWIGGSYQSGTLRYGNGLECTGDCSYIDFNYNTLYQAGKDAGISAQSSSGEDISNINIKFNTISKSRYCLEFFNHDGTDGDFDYVFVDHNTCYMSGGGYWGTSAGQGIRTGAFDYPVVNFNITNNIFYSATAYGVYIDNDLTSSEITLNNNLYYEDNAADIVVSYNAIDYAYSDFSDYQSTTGQDSNSATGTPSFMDDVNNDFRPASGNAACSMSSTSSYVGALPCASSTCSCTGGECDINLGDNCIQSSNITSGNITFTGSGTFTCNATITANLTFCKITGCDYLVTSKCKLKGKYN